MKLELVNCFFSNYDNYDTSSRTFEEARDFYLDLIEMDLASAKRFEAIGYHDSALRYIRYAISDAANYAELSNLYNAVYDTRIDAYGWIHDMIVEVAEMVGYFTHDKEELDVTHDKEEPDVVYVTYSLTRDGSRKFGLIFNTYEDEASAYEFVRWAKHELRLDCCYFEATSVESFKAHPSLKEVIWL